MGVAVDMALKFDIAMVKRLKLKVRNFGGLIPTFIEVIGEKLIGGIFLAPPTLNRVNTRILSGTSFNANIINFKEMPLEWFKEIPLADHYLTRTGRARYKKIGILLFLLV